MAEIRDMGKISTKWKTVTGGAAQQYQDGVQNPKKDWEKETAAGERNYEAGVTAAIGRKAFGKGVKSAGTEGWQSGAITKGVTRFPQGVAASGDAYEVGFTPYHSVIKSLVLPPRGPKGSEGNYDRVKKVGQALHAKKTSM